VGGELHFLTALLLGEELPSSFWIGGWMVPRAGLEDMEKRELLTIPELKNSDLLGRPTHRQYLYRLLNSSKFRQLKVIL
jgi:hypothetical protein